MSSEVFGPRGNFIIEDEPMADYHSKWWWLSKSVIEELLKTPRNFHYKFLKEDGLKISDTKSQSMGTDIHAMLLEFARFKDLYISGPIGKDRRHNAYKELVDKNPNKIVIPYKEFQLLEAIHEAVLEQKVGRYFLNLDGTPEVSCYWNDPDFNQTLKCRPDLLFKSKNFVVDLKTTSSEGKYEFEKTASIHNYHISAALTMRGLKIITGEYFKYLFLVVETKPPFNVSLYTFEPEDIIAGNAAIDRAILDYQRCQEENKWPGYYEGVQKISLPSWRKGSTW